MTAEFWAIIGVGVALGGLHWQALARINALSDRIGGVEQRLAAVEAKVDILVHGLHIQVQGRETP